MKIKTVLSYQRDFKVVFTFHYPQIYSCLGRTKSAALQKKQLQLISLNKNNARRRAITNDRRSLCAKVLKITKKKKIINKSHLNFTVVVQEVGMKLNSRLCIKFCFVLFRNQVSAIHFGWTITKQRSHWTCKLN